MKYRQAKKICDRITTADLVTKTQGEAIIVVGLRHTRYNYKQFREAYIVMNRRFRHHYEENHMRRFSKI